MQEWKNNTSLGELLEGDHNMDREGNDERCKSMDDLVGPILAYIEWGWYRLIGFCKAGLSLSGSSSIDCDLFSKTISGVVLCST